MNIFKRFGSGRNERVGEDRTEAILTKHLDGDFQVFPMAESRTSLSQIERIGLRHGVRYPDEFAAHMCGRFPGIYVEVNESLWPRPKKFDVGPFWSFLYALHTFTSAPESEEWMRLDIVAESFQQKTGLIAAPILKVVGDADVYCVDAEGRLVQFDHELNELRPLDLGFWQLFDREVGELRARKERKKGGA